jgi:hypothetical protein
MSLPWSRMINAEKAAKVEAEMVQDLAMGKVGRVKVAKEPRSE